MLLWKHLEVISLYMHIVHWLWLYVGNYDSDDIEDFIKESLHMKAFHHPNVMKLVGVCFDAGSAPYIIIPFMAGMHC